jgi:RNA polymerase sigma-B factor
MTMIPAGGGAECPPVVPAAGAVPPQRNRPGRNLPELDDKELLAIARALPRAGADAVAAREQLVVRYRPLVRSCVARYRRSPEPAEDLMQVGYLGLMKAINGFDLAVGGSLGAYAQPTIAGELRRHFRDGGWSVHVRRSAQELMLAVRVATEDLTHELGRAPAEAELAARLGASSADLRDVAVAESAYAPFSLDAAPGGAPGDGRLADLLGGDDPRIEQMLGMQAVAAHWDELPAREQIVLTLRFHGDLSQAEIGRRIGVSQMQVSRLISHALGYLRPLLLG